MKNLIFIFVAVMTGALVTGIVVGKISYRLDTLENQVELIRTMDDYTSSPELIGDNCEK